MYVRDCRLNEKKVKESHTVPDFRIPSFILPEWRQLDDIVGKPKGEWWLNNALIAWFERKSDDRMKFIIEVGPLEYERRLRFLNYLEDNAVRVREKSKEVYVHKDLYNEQED